MKDKKPVNGWLYWTSDAGQYGTDYEQRAMVTMIGPGLNFPQDALYPFSEKDADGKDYDGSKHGYVMRFEKGQMPADAVLDGTCTLPPVTRLEDH